VKRNEVIQIKVSPQEKELIKAKGDMSAYVRGLILRDLGLSDEGPFDHDDPVTARQKAEVPKGEYEVQVEAGTTQPDDVMAHFNAQQRDPAYNLELSKKVKQLIAQGMKAEEALETARKRMGL
jgi:hypothetical protein